MHNQPLLPDNFSTASRFQRQEPCFHKLSSGGDTVKLIYINMIAPLFIQPIRYASHMQ